MFGFKSKSKQVTYPPAYNGTIKFVLDKGEIHPKAKIDSISLRSIGGREVYTEQEREYLTVLVKMHGYDIAIEWAKSA